MVNILCEISLLILTKPHEVSIIIISNYEREKLRLREVRLLNIIQLWESVRFHSLVVWYQSPWHWTLSYITSPLHMLIKRKISNYMIEWTSFPSSFRMLLSFISCHSPTCHPALLILLFFALKCIFCFWAFMHAGPSPWSTFSVSVYQDDTSSAVKWWIPWHLFSSSSALL